MRSQRAGRVSVRAAAGAAAITLLLAGCGAGSGQGPSTTRTAAKQGSNATVARGGGVSIQTATGTAGSYLTGQSGRALYLWLGDRHDVPSCSGACASAWPPVIARGKPAAAGAAQATELGTVRRSNGSSQLTYKGHPLYYFSGDLGAGTTNGQGSDGFGAKWWLVSPSGAAITQAPSGGSWG